MAETVLRLVSRDGGQAALRMVSRALREMDERKESERRAYLLNLRGIVYAQQHKEAEALADLSAACTESHGWHVPWFNLALCHKRAHRWREAGEALSRAAVCTRSRSASDKGDRGDRGDKADRGMERAILWNLGIVHTALKRWDEARAAWHALGLTLPIGKGAPEMDLGLAQLSLPTKGVYAAERVWVQRLDPARARILSVVRYGAPCQFGDVVLCESGDGATGFCDGVSHAAEGDRGGRQGQGGSGGAQAAEGQRDASLTFLDILDPAGYVLHVIRGDAATPAQATSLTERMREAEFHIEVWSLTMRLPDDNPATLPENGAVPLCAGLVVPLDWQDPPSVAERAIAELETASREMGLSLFAPTLYAAAGDELGAARHKKALRLRNV